MKQSSLWIVGGLLLGAGVGIARMLQSDASVCVPEIKPGSRVLLVGDSLAVGLSPYLKTICSRNGADFMSLSESGTRIAQWVAEPRRSKLAAALQSFAPTLVLVSLGTNDSKGNSTAAELGVHVAKLKSLLTGPSVYWICPPKLPFPERVCSIVQASGIKSFASSSYEIPQGDGIHPTGAGYAGWAELIALQLVCLSNASASTGTRQPLGTFGKAPLRPSKALVAMGRGVLPSPRRRRAKAGPARARGVPR